MPTVHREAGFRFFFVMADVSGDRPEPEHVHVDGNGGMAKVWLRTLSYASCRGYSATQRADILRIVAQQRGAMLGKWDEERARTQG